MSAHQRRISDSPAPARPAPAAWRSARETLCVRLDQIGDVLMTGPAIRALVAGGRRVTLLGAGAGAAIAELMPEVDDTIVYAAPWMKSSGADPDPDADATVIREISRRRFDAAVIFTVATQSPLPAALMLRLAGVPLRLAHCRENPYALLTDWVPEPEGPVATRHEVRRQLDLVATVGAHTGDERLALTVPAHARERVAGRLRALGLGRRWAAVHVGSTASSRRYPPELFAAACASLAGEHGVDLVFTGDESEIGLVEAVRAEVPVPTATLAGELSLAELVAVLGAAPLLISGNTGPVHLAAAVGTPVLDIYALTNPQHTPWGVPNVTLTHDVPCRWCLKSVCPEGHHLCLRGIRPKDVVKAALCLLANPDGVQGAPWQSPLGLGGAASG
jgi:ADP-heptose:LPS heptosyltransferase